jgi:hypothetical protein
MQITAKDHPVVFTLIGIAVLVIYGLAYRTEGHARAASVLRAPPYSYSTLIIYRYRWSETRTDIRYIGYSASGITALEARFDGQSGVLKID